MRCESLLVSSVTIAFLCAAAQASPLDTEWALFKPDTAGCVAANAGALDLRIKVNHSGDEEGQLGSGLVSGFRAGDTLMIVRKSNTGHRELSFILSAIDSQQITTVFSLDEATPSNSQNPVADQVKFVIPPNGSGWALFSNTSGVEDVGEYNIVVRCAPGDASDPGPTS